MRIKNAIIGTFAAVALAAGVGAAVGIREAKGVEAATNTYTGTATTAGAIAGWTGTGTGTYSGAVKFDSTSDSYKNASIWSGDTSKYMTGVSVTISYKINGTASSDNVFTVNAIDSSSAILASATIAPTSTTQVDATFSNLDVSTALTKCTGLQLIYTTKKSGNVALYSVTATATYDDSMAVTLSSSESSLAINKSATGSVTLTPNNFVVDHYTTSFADSGIASASIAANVITVSGLADGTTTMTVSGFDSADGSAVATVDVSITVNEQALKASPATTTLNTSATKNVTLTASYFNSTSITYSATSSDETVATVAIADSSIGAAVITSLSKVGETTITYTATDATGTATATTAVTVAAPSITLSTSSLDMGLSSGSQDLTITQNRFNGDATYDYSFSAAGIATASITGTTVTVTPSAIGTTILTITGTYGEQTASSTCTVKVSNVITGSNRLTISANSANHLANDIVPVETTAASLYTWTSDFFTFTQSNGGGIDIVTNNDDIRAYTSHVLTWTPSSNVSITSIIANVNTGKPVTALTDSTFVNATTSTSGQVVTITPTVETTAVSVTLGAQSRIDSIVVNYSYEPTTPELWASSFLTTLSCDSTGVTAPSTSAWSSLATSFAELEAADRLSIKGATANIGGTKVEQAVARYDYILNKYGTTNYANFIDRAVSGGTAGLLEGTSDAFQYGMIAIAALSVVGLLAGAGFIAFRKKHD